MHKSNVKTEETVQVNRGDFICLLSTGELEALSSEVLNRLHDMYRSEAFMPAPDMMGVDDTYLSAAYSCADEINRILSLRRSQPVIHFFDQNCDLLVERYSNGTTSLRLFSDGPVATATVCLPEVLLPEGYVLIKDYDENTGVLAALVFSGIVKDTGQTYPVGRFNHANFCRLTL